MTNRKNKNKQKAIIRIDGQGNYYTEKMLPMLQQVVPKGTFARAGQAIGALGGGYMGSRAGGAGARIGAAAGKFAGGRLGHGLSRIVGFGDYQVQANSLVKEGMAITPGESVPNFGVIGHATRVRHREYIGDIVIPTSPTTFTNTSYTINPGSKTTFPWLAALASNYQQYRFEGLVFEFKTLSSDISAGGALGSLILATNYDVLEGQYADKIHMENSQYAVSAKPSVSQIHTIECDPAASANNLWYVRDSSSVTSGTDSRLFDLGKFQVATAGLPGSAGEVLGELWASYDVSLFKPEITLSSFSQKTLGASSISKTAIFGSAPTSTLDALFTVTSNTLTFAQSATVYISLYLVGTGCTTLTITGTGAVVTTIATVNATGIAGQYDYVLTGVTGQTIIFDATAFTTVTASTLRAAVVDASLT